MNELEELIASKPILREQIAQWLCDLNEWKWPYDWDLRQTGSSLNSLFMVVSVTNMKKNDTNDIAISCTTFAENGNFYGCIMCYDARR
jgi:hypothetical protein